MGKTRTKNLTSAWTTRKSLTALTKKASVEKREESLIEMGEGLEGKNQRQRVRTTPSRV